MRRNPSTDPESPVRDPARDHHNGRVLIVVAFRFAYLQILKQFLGQSMTCANNH